MYNAKGKIVFDPATSRGNQIGVGVYTTPGPGDWAGNPGDWSAPPRTIHARRHVVNSRSPVNTVDDRHCQITARESAIRKIPKLWVPREYFWIIGSGRNTNPMYDWAERVLQGKADFDTSFHLSVIDRHDPPGLKQLVIPTYLLSGHGLDLKVTCKADYRALPDNKRVNYSSWPNTFGTPQ